MLLSDVTARFTASGRDCRHPGPSTWPPAVQALAIAFTARRSRRPGAPPTDVRAVAAPSPQLAGALSPRAFGCTSPGPSVRSAEAHQLRDAQRAAGRAAALFHAGVPQALQQASGSDSSYTLESAKLTAVGAALHMTPLGSPAGGAATMAGVRPGELPGPIPGRLGLLPAGAPQHGSPCPDGGFPPAPDLRRLWLGPASARLLTDEDIAGTHVPFGFAIKRFLFVAAGRTHARPLDDPDVPGGQVFPTPAPGSRPRPGPGWLHPLLGTPKDGLERFALRAHGDRD